VQRYDRGRGRGGSPCTARSSGGTGDDLEQAPVILLGYTRACRCRDSIKRPCNVKGRGESRARRI
jgi:hypothetical protein